MSKKRKAALGPVFQAARAKQDKTLRELATEVGLSNAFLCQIEDNAEKRLLQARWMTLDKVARAYKLTTTYLYDRLRDEARRQGLL